jgi:hypothetical protein
MSATPYYATKSTAFRINVDLRCISHQRDVPAWSAAGVCSSDFILSSSSSTESSSSRVDTQPATRSLYQFNISYLNSLCLCKHMKMCTCLVLKNGETLGRVLPNTSKDCPLQYLLPNPHEIINQL